MKTHHLPFRSYVLASSVWLLLLNLSVSCTKDDTPLPAEETVRIRKIVWNPTDYRQYSYNANGQITRYFSNWTYTNEGSGGIMQQTAGFEYSSSGLLTKVTFDSGYYNKYYFDGNTLKKTEEYDSKGRLRLTHLYTFNVGRQLTESVSQVHDLVEGEANQFKQSYSYDSRGNLTEQRLFNKLPGQASFTLSSITKYEEYDTKKSADNLTINFPYLPGTIFYKNNPGRITHLGADGTTVLSAYLHTYTYNEKEYPSQKSTLMQTSPVVVPLTATYEYE